MKHFVILAAMTAAGFICAQNYKGLEVNGPEVIGCWEFNPGKETEDSSGKGHTLKFHGGAKLVPGGINGPALLSTGGGPQKDYQQGASVSSKPELSPKGPFAAEISFKLNKDFSDYQTIYFLDKKIYFYAQDTPRANMDYGFYATRSGNHNYIFNVTLGFGKDSLWAQSPPVKLTADEWHHTAFSYDGAGTVRIFLDNKQIYRNKFEGRGPITPGYHQLCLGERAGSTFWGLPGAIDQVRITNGIPDKYKGTVELSTGLSRTAFYRFENDASVGATIFNDTSVAITNSKLIIEMNGTSRTFDLGILEKEQKKVFTLPIDSSLKAGNYPLKLTAEYQFNGKTVTKTREIDIAIVPRPLPFFPVVMWQTGDTPRLKDIGFTHDLRNFSEQNLTWKKKRPIDIETETNAVPTVDMLNQRMKDQLHVCLQTAPGRYASYMTNPEYKRHDREGNIVNPKNANVSHPHIQEFGYNVGVGVAKAFGRFPIFDMALIHSEIRDNTAISFSEPDVKRAEAAIGGPIPAAVEKKSGVLYQTIKDFPADRVIKDDDPILKFYKWFWKDGDGWNPLHTQVHNGLKSTGRNDIKTFFDPAVRAPSIWGSGGKVDYLSQWTYSYPDAIKIGMATDELFAMAQGCPGQDVMKMTQVIWYRSQTAIRNPDDKSLQAQWEKDIPEADFITISPDHLSEAFWSMIARPVKGIMYHGWESLVDCKATKSYCFTNPNTAPRLKQLIADVIRPVGPTLLQVPDMPADIAILESFASQIFAQRGSLGWSSSWEADMHLIFQWAGLQPKIIYEETIAKDGLDDIKILVMPFCDVLPESIVSAIKNFQKRGGIVVSDQFLCPAIMPDHIISYMKRTGQADADKKALQTQAVSLKTLLKEIYTAKVYTDNPDVVPRLRKYNSSLYLFTINDKRTFGKYVGQYKLVMEDGLPASANVDLAFKGYAYDLIKHQAVSATTTSEGIMRLAQSFGPGEGKLTLLTKTPIEKVSIQAGKTASSLVDFPVKVSVTSAKGTAPDAIIPVQITITDPRGEQSEFSGFYAAKDGIVNTTLRLAKNDLPGEWSVTAKELAAGNTATAKFIKK